MDNVKYHILSEHTSKKLCFENELNFEGLIPRLFKSERNQNYYAFHIKKHKEFIHLKADYFVGIDWLIPGEHIVQVEPKINTGIIDHFEKQLAIPEDQGDEIEVENKKAKDEIKGKSSSDKNIVELNYIGMLWEVMANPITSETISSVVLIDWKSPRIPVSQKQDKLTPFLIAQFLQLLKAIVRKGLKKSYYKVERNLKSRIKGKVLISENIKRNVFKNKLTSTYCSFQVYGEDNSENRFLKKVYRFASAYFENNSELFNGSKTQIKHSINYCRPAFEHIGEEVSDQDIKFKKQNSFFKEYKEALKIGEYILKKFGYNITKTSEQENSTPPFWIDMPSLFESYFYAKLLKANPKKSKGIDFQFSTYGNALDFLVSESGYEMVIDTKYKLQYKWGKVHNDIRQVSGYARLKKVRKKVGLEENENSVIDCLIVYPNLKSPDEDLTLEYIKDTRVSINSYYKVYKLGIYLPLV